MIDTDKYEGHIEGSWFDGEATEISNAIANGIMQKFPNELGKATLQLAVDAPLLLEEVKRLRGVIAQVWDLMQNSNHEEREMFFWGFDKKNTGWLKVHEELAMKELNWGEEE